MNNSLVAIITGGGTGIGAATAAVLRSQGWEVIICGRRAETLNKVALNTGAIPIVADITVTEDIEHLIKEAIERFGKINGLVLNAGVVNPGIITELPEKDWNEMIHVNLTSPYLLLKFCLPHLISSKGVIIGVASAAALRATDGIPGYTSSKAGLAMLMQSVGVDYGSQGIRANTVCPGWVRTEMADKEMEILAEDLNISLENAYQRAAAFIPSGKPAEPIEIGRFIAWLMSSEASYINAAVLPIDGGLLARDPGSLGFDARFNFN